MTKACFEAAELLGELEAQFRTGAALAMCQGGVFTLELQIQMTPKAGRDVAALLATVRAGAGSDE